MKFKFDNKKCNVVGNIFNLILYVFMWVMIVLVLYIFYFIYLEAVKDAFGTVLVATWCILGAVVFLSYIWCRIIFKNRKRIKLLLPYALSILFFAFSIFFNYMGNKQFEEFSTVRWNLRSFWANPTELHHLVRMGCTMIMITAWTMSLHIHFTLLYLMEW